MKLTKLISPFLYSLGIYQKRWKKRSEQRGKAVVIYYHRIVANQLENQGKYRDEQGITAEDFEAHLRFMLKHFDPVRPSELFNTLQSPGLKFAVTFDDGYEDNFSVALPILERLGLSAAFFVVSDFLDKDHMFWWEHIAQILRDTKKDQLSLIDVDAEWPKQFNCEATLSLANDDDSYSTQNELTAILRKTPPKDIPKYLHRIADLLEVPYSIEGRGYPMLTWDQARQMASSGHDIGGHTANHINMGFYDSTVDFDSEVVTPADIIKEKIGKFPDIFAYPYGRQHHFNKQAKEDVERVGHSMAFTTIKGVVSSSTDPYAIPRVSLNNPSIFACAYNIEDAFQRTSNT